MQQSALTNMSLLSKIKNIRLGMQAKLLATAIPILLFFTILMSFGIVKRENDLMYNDTVQQALGIAKSAALLYTNARIYEELRMVDSSGMSEYLEYFMDDMMRLDPRMRTFFILDAKGQVIAHNNLREYGKIYNDANTVNLLAVRKDFVEEIHTADNQYILRITVPLAIGSKFWGLCRVDFSLNEMYAYSSRLRNEVLMLATLFLLLSIGVVWIAGWHFVTPIRKLTHNMNTITLQGKVTQHLPILPTRDDEIGELHNSFVWMLNRLHNAEQDRLQNIEKMLQTEKMAAVGQLASGLAHEINNPLGGTILCFQNLCEGDMDEATRKQHIEVINGSLEKIRLTVSDFLRFARPAPLAIRETSIQKVFAHCQNLATFTLSRQSIDIHIDIMQDMPDVQLDLEKISQVLLNLILNAAYALENSQKRDSNKNAVLLKSYVENKHVHIIVADTGEGIAKDVQEKIFNPFFSTKPEGKGTGLGLAVSSALIAQHGGTLKIINDTMTHDNIVYAGAVFEMILPLHFSTDC